MSITLWLNDLNAQTISGVTATETLGPQTILTYMIPQHIGSWHLWAAADDGCGNHTQTGLVRIVTVQ